MADMEALFAEMRKAQTGGRDFAAEARAAAGASDDSELDSTDTDSEADASATKHLPPRAMDAARTKACVRVSELGRVTAREAKTARRARSAWGVDDDAILDLPDPALEAARHRAVAGVAATFESACGKTIGGRWWSHFEAWLYARREASSRKREKQKKYRLSGASAESREGGARDGDDRSTSDPAIPDPSLARSDRALERKLEAAGMGRYEIVGVGMELSKACARAHATLAAARGGKSKPVKMSAPFEVGDDRRGGRDGDEETRTRGKATKVAMTHGKTRLEVNVETLEKLRALHSRHASPKQARGDERRFRHDAFCVLARYGAARGTHHKAGTMQAAAPGAVFAALRETFGVEAELCASPVNCHWRVFGSAFLDVDRHFGSIGDAFAFEPSSGSFQANPPFDASFIARLAERLDALLRKTAEKKHAEPLSFCVILPHWPDQTCWKALTGSAYARKPILHLRKNRHAYVAGARGTRAARATPASAASDVVFLQNEAGARAWPVSAETLKAIERGFTEGVRERDSNESNDDSEEHRRRRGSSSPSSSSGGEDETRRATSRGSGTEERDATRLSRGKVWDPDEFLFWGVGSAKRWGERPAEWVLDAAGDVLEAHWVGEDPDSEEEEDEENEGDEAEEGDSEEESGEDEDEASESDLELEGEAAESPDGESDDGDEEEEDEEESDEDDEDALSSEEEESDERARKRRR